MKKLLFLFALLLTSIGAWAQTNTDGPIVTFTNVQKNGKTFTLYITDEGALAASTDDAATLGAKAQFRATLQSNGKYTFYNEAKGLYMIWRNNNSANGYDGGDGVMSEYKSAYCDWTLEFERNAERSGKDETFYYIIGKRKNGTDDGTLILHRTNYFETWSSGIAWGNDYSNLFRIEVVGSFQYTFTDTQSNQQYTGTTTSLYPVVVAGGVTLSNKAWSNGHFTADFTYNIPVSDGENTNRVIIGSFNDFNNKYFADGTSVKANRNSTAPLPNNVDPKNYLWAFYPGCVDGIFKFKVMNIGTCYYLKSESANANHTGSEVSLVEGEVNATLFELTASNQLINSKGYRLSNNSTTGDEIKFAGTYNTNHDGTKNKIVDANNYTLTLADGSTFVGTNGVHNLMGGSYTYTNGTWRDNGYSATVNVDFASLPFPVSSAEKVNPTMISSFNEGAGGYGPGRFKWYAAKDDDGDDDVKIKRDALVTEDLLETYSWAIYPSMENGAFAYSIKNVALSKYIQATKNFGASDGDNNEGTIILSDTPTKFSVDSNNSLYFFANERNQYLSLGSSGTTDGFLGIHTKTYADGHKGITNAFLTPRYALASKDELKSGGIYTFLTARGWVGATDSDNVIATANTAVTPAASTENAMFQWALYQSKNGNYYLYNLGKEMFMGDVAQSVNEGDIPFADSPMNKNMTFKDNAQAANFPIMFSTNNTHAVSQNTAKGLFAWKGGWNNNDEGSNHQVSYIGELDAEQLKTIADLVEAYDKSMPMKVEVEGSWENNPNTHFGNLTVTTGSAVATTKLTLENMEVNYLEYTSAGDSFNFTREYRGFEFQGFFLGEENLGKSFTLTEAQEANITEQNPLVAKFTATEAVTLFYDDDPFSYRIPAIAKTSTGRLIAVSDYRHNLDDIGRDNHGTGTKRIDLVARVSNDNGQTWSETKTIAAGDNSKSGLYQRAFGDAAIVAVGQNVVVMAAAGDQVYNGATTASPNRMARIFSSDNGETWSINEVTSQMYNSETSLLPNGVAAFFGSGKLVVDENFNSAGKARIYGALLVRTHNNGTYNNYNNYVVYSDDLGENWEILGGSTDAIANGDEPKVEILPSGQILLSARRGGGRKFNVFTYGSEAGDKANGVGTWSGAADGCGNGGSNATNGEIMCIDAKKPDGTAVILLLQSQPKGGGDQYDRKDVTIWYKEITDQAYTTAQIKDNWTEGLQVSTQKSAYSAMAEQADDKIAFFFEEAPCYGDDHTKGYSMVYVPLTVESITKGNYFSKNADLSTTRNIKVVLTDAEGNVYKDELNASLTGIGTALTTEYPFITLGNNVGINLVDESYTYTNTVTLPFKVSNNENTYWHNIYIPSNGEGTRYPVYFYSNAYDATVKTKTEENEYGASTYNTKQHADNMSWAIYSINNGFAFAFKNKLTGNYIKVTQPASNASENVEYDNTKAKATAFSLEKNASYIGDYIIKHNDGHLSANSATNGTLTFYNGNYHWGSTAKIVEAPDFDALIDEANAVLNLFGDGLGQYSNISGENLTAINAAKSAMEDAGSVRLNILNEYIGYTSKTDGGTLNLPETGKFYYIQSANTNQYLSHIKSNTLTTTAQKSVNNIFYFESDGEDTYLVAYENGTM